MMDSQLFDIPVVERPVIFELERADGVRDAFDGVGLPVREIVHGIDRPHAARPVMLGVENAVHDGIAQIEIGRGHVDLRAQGAGAIGKFAHAHAFEKIEALLDGTVAVRAFPARLGQCAAILAHLIARKIANVGFAGAHQFLRPLVELAEIVGGVKSTTLPIETQPAHVVHDGVNVFLLFFFGIGVIEPEVCFAAELRGQTEVQADGFGVPDMEVAVGFGRESRVDAPTILIGFQVFEDDLANEIGTRRRDIGWGWIHIDVSWQFQRFFKTGVEMSLDAARRSACATVCRSMFAKWCT